MIDIGLNLTNPQFASDREAVLLRAQQAGVEAVILTGTDLDDSAAAATLAAGWPQFAYSTAGLHPHDARHWDAGSATRLRSLAAAPQVVAIGECGLDFNRDFSPRPQQEAAFVAQLELAVELNKPVFLHCRDAHARFTSLLAPYLRHLPGAVLHCFTGTADELSECLTLGLHIGITGWVCDERRGETLRALVPQIPAGRLMIETDAPYLLPRDLSPKPTSRRNEPAYLPHIAATVAALRGESCSALLAHTRATSRAFFRLDEVLS
ncbi:3'-5' ssDNA/RNA exonuclease TatD [Pseudaeromonas sharmana]|uniref:3'-5' ssDNA/RNA exonuclease TatD n=1 Tax=Pseudaeromonas sharmana TaxID=328412 RepID=A0ABV8CMY4_9GAMM